MNEHRSISIANQIFEQLEQDILIGKYKKGEVLTELRLCETLGVSRTPIREAMSRLAQEHIIEETNRGAVVVGISREDIEDMYEIRMRIEGMAVERAVKNMTDEQIQKLREIIELQKYYVEKSDRDNSDSIKEYDSQFHEMLYECCKSRALCDALMPIHKKLIKYRKSSVSVSSRAKESLEEHTAILKAIENRDAKKASELALCHIANARDNILKKEID